MTFHVSHDLRLISGPPQLTQAGLQLGSVFVVCGVSMYGGLFLCAFVFVSCISVCVCVCVCARVRVCVYALYKPVCVSVCVCVCVCV